MPQPAAAQGVGSAPFWPRGGAAQAGWPGQAAAWARVCASTWLRLEVRGPRTSGQHAETASWVVSGRGIDRLEGVRICLACLLDGDVPLAHVLLHGRRIALGG